MTRRRAIALLAAGVCLFVAGELPGQAAMLLDLGGSAITPRTLTPSFSMDISSYDIRGVGPDPLVDTFERLGYTGGQLRLEGLAPGVWTITVDARNLSAVIVGRGQTQITVTQGEPASENVLIAPLTGDGGLELTLQFASGTMDAGGSVVATLAPADGAPAFVEFRLSPPTKPKQGKYTNGALTAGYYVVTVRVTRDDGSVWGTVEAVRIIEGQTTTHTWNVN